MVRCLSNAECASNLCEGGICVSPDTEVDADPDAAQDAADAMVEDVAVDSDDDTADTVSDTGTGTDTDTGTDADAGDATDVLTPSDVIDAADAGDATDVFDAPDLADVPIDPDLLPPTGLQASDGTAADSVALTWSAVEGADGYRVYRDGTAVADVDATAWDDVDATRGAAGHVDGVEATTDDPFGVTVTWSAAGEGLPGAAHRYEVATLRDDAVSAPSAPDDGYTAASPVAGYELGVDGAVIPVDGRTWRDTAAAPPTVVVSGLSAAWDGAAVQLGALGAAGVRGASHEYRVRARTNAGGVGAWSDDVTGWRDAGPLEFAWQRSASDRDATYSTVVTTTTPAATDPEGPPVGQGRYYRLQLGAAGTAAVTTASVRVERPDAPVPDAPTDVNASDGTSAEHVAVTWSEVSGATSYDVYRDDVLVASAVTGTSWQDVDAAQGSAPAAPGGVAASSDQTDRVQVAWDAAAPGRAGRAHAYALAARNGAGAGARSVSDDGYRAAPTVAGYEISIDSGAWQDAGSSTARSWNDTGAPAGMVTGGMANASDGASTAHVSLSLSGATASLGALRMYGVRAVAGDGRAGAASSAVSGRRVVGALAYQWQRTSTDDSSGPWSDLPGATSASFDDDTAPSDESARWYRCLVSAAGAESATSTPDRGFRSMDGGGSPLGAVCAGDATCESGHCGNGRCAPVGFAYVEPGSFMMGSPSGEVGRDSDEAQHSVMLTRAYFMQQTEVTQAQWRTLMGNNPSSFTACGDNCPVETVTWYEALSYANALSDAEGLAPCYALSGCSNTPGNDMECTGVSVAAAGGNPLLCEGYRLPTESEWEHAARAGTTTATYRGNLQEPFGCDPQPNLEPIAWYCENADGTTRQGATIAANDWGLHDMLGNVWEWCWDWHGAYPGMVTDPLGAASGPFRVLRGGSWINTAQAARAARRGVDLPGDREAWIGFRLARTAP